MYPEVMFYVVWVICSFCGDYCVEVLCCYQGILTFSHKIKIMFRYISQIKSNLFSNIIYYLPLILLGITWPEDHIAGWGVKLHKVPRYIK
jgi:hypothetical protein